MAVPKDPDLQKLSEQFVRVRLIQMGGVDLAQFQFDPLLSWAVFLMHPDGTIYGRYGTTHEQTRRNLRDSNPTHTTAGLAAALARGLELHESYVADPKTVGPTLAPKKGIEPKWRFAEKTPAARRYGRLRRSEGGTNGCVHCHEVARVTLDSYMLTKTPIPDRLLWMYPRTHVLGLEFDEDHCARVRTVTPDSPAAAAGLQPGDDVLSIDAQPLVSVADVRFLLHNLPDEGGKLDVRVRRGDETVDTVLELPDDWRRAEDFGWRFRVAGYAMWLWAGVTFEDRAGGLTVSQRSPNWFKKTNRDGRQKLQPGDVLLEVDGQKGLSRSDLIAYLIRDKKPGSTVKLRIRRKGETEKIDFRVPNKRPEILGH